MRLFSKKTNGWRRLLPLRPRLMLASLVRNSAARIAEWIAPELIETTDDYGERLIAAEGL